MGKAITWILIQVFVHFGDIRHKADGKESGCRNFVHLSTEDVLGEMMLFMARSKSEVIGIYIYTIWKNTSVLAQFSPGNFLLKFFLIKIRGQVAKLKG